MVENNNPEIQGGHEQTGVELFAGMVHDMVHERERPLAGDVRIQAYNVAALRELDTNPEFREVLWGFTAERPGLSYTHANQFVLRSAQNVLLRLDPSHYPRDYVDPNKWTEGFRRILDNEDALLRFTDNLHFRDVKSNIDDRFRSIRLLEHALLQAGRLHEPFVVVDFGASRNHCLIKLKLASIIDRWDISFEGVEAGKVTARNKFLGNAALTKTINRILGTQSSIDYGLGLDIDSLQDVDAQLWTESCSFYPTEILRETYAHKRRWDHFALLELQRIPGIDHVQMDLCDPVQTQTIPDILGGRTATMAVANTFLYQRTEEERSQILQDMGSIVGEDGIVVVQDFVKVDPEDPSKLHFLREWSDPWLFRTVIKDMRAPEKGWQEVFVWNNGRCEKLGRVAGELVVDDNVEKPIRELLLAA